MEEIDNLVKERDVSNVCVFFGFFIVFKMIEVMEVVEVM